MAIASPSSATPGALAGPDFESPAAIPVPALDADRLVPLPHLGAIRVSGADAETFLQGQLSSDVAALQTGRAGWSSHNSPKGRVLALFQLLRDPDGDILLWTRAELIDALLRRLRLYVLRSKVALADLRGSIVSIGLSGPSATALLSRASLPVPSQAGDVIHHEAIQVLRHDGEVPRVSIHAPRERASALWRQFATDTAIAHPDFWRLHDLLAGLPAVTLATQDRFVAQMLDLDRLGGISYTKGCYTGQEVIARLHYLGTLKRHLVRGRTASETVTSGMALLDGTPDAAAATVGEVLEAAPHPDGGSSVLAVIQERAAALPVLRLGDAAGAEVRLEHDADRASGI